MRFRELFEPCLPGVIEFEIRFDVVAQLQTLQSAERDLGWEMYLVLLIEDLLQERLELRPHFQPLQVHLLTSLV